MAAKRTRAFAFYIGNKKVAEATGNKVDLQGGSEYIPVMDGGVFSDGRKHGTYSIDTIELVSGQSVNLIDKFLNGEIFRVSFQSGGAFLMADAKLNGVSLSSDAQSGKTTGNYSLIVGEPDKA